MYIDSWFNKWDFQQLSSEVGCQTHESEVVASHKKDESKGRSSEGKTSFYPVTKL